MPTRCLVVLSLVLMSSAAEAQTRRIVSRGWPTPPPAQPSDVIAEDAPVLPVPSEDAGQAPAVAEAPAITETRPAVRASALQVFGQTSLRASLPSDWPQGTADESRMPAYARYTFQAPAGPLAGTVLRVERVTGLNPAEEQQWRGGQTPYGYHGARPVAVLPSGGDALVTFETIGMGLAGVTAFTQRGRTFWALSVVTPGAVWNARRAEVAALISSVTIPAGDPVPGVVAAPRR